MGAFTFDVIAQSGPTIEVDQQFTLTIGKAPLTITAANAARAQGASNPSFTVAYSGLVNGDTPARLSGKLAIGTTATTSSAPGAYPIVPSGLSSSLYEITYVNGTLTVTASSGRQIFLPLVKVAGL